MIEEIGQLDIKVCGYQHCCFTTHLDNDDTNFERGDLDVFAGPGAIVQCNEFLISDEPYGPVEVTVFHEGTDGITLDYVSVRTDIGLLNCPINANLDNGDYFNAKCSMNTEMKN